MLNIKVNRDIKFPGDAMAGLRQIADLINRGHKSGEGWAIGEGEQTVEAAHLEDQDRAQLDALTDQLHTFIGSQEISDDELRVAAEELLPALHDQLRKSGFGNEEVKIYQFTKDWGDRKEGEVISDEDLGDGVIFKDLINDGTIVEVTDAQNATESDEKELDGGKVENDENDQPRQPQQATQGAPVVGEATIAANEPEKKKKPWFQR